MKIASFLVAPLFLLACSSPDRNRPELARSEVVTVANQPADQIAARVCGLLHGAKVGGPEDRAGGCTSQQHAAGHAADGTSHVSLIADARSNAIVMTVAPGYEKDLERAIALVRELDQPTTASK
jgi:type II secretory pathway component GspD/PulD (secretin)